MAHRDTSVSVPPEPADPAGGGRRVRPGQQFRRCQPAAGTALEHIRRLDVPERLFHEIPRQTVDREALERTRSPVKRWIGRPSNGPDPPSNGGSGGPRTDPIPRQTVDREALERTPIPRQTGDREVLERTRSPVKRGISPPGADTRPRAGCAVLNTRPSEYAAGRCGGGRPPFAGGSALSPRAGTQGAFPVAIACAWAETNVYHPARAASLSSILSLAGSILISP